MRKTSLHLLMLLVISTFLLSCTKSPKTFLLSEGVWLIGNTDNQILQFNNDETVSFGNGNSYQISWIDDFTFNLTWDGNIVIFKFNEFKKDKLKVAILYENEKLPLTEEDWMELQNNERVLELVKNAELHKAHDYYNLNGVKVPANKVPPAGLYLTNGNDGLAINVITENGKLKFQSGENKNELHDANVSIEFEGLSPEYLCSFDLSNEWGSCEYIGNGIIVNSSYLLNGNSGEITKFVKINTPSGDDNLISKHINQALDYGFIFKDEAKISGRIVKLEFIKKPNESGCVFAVPDDKMWTPLFFKYEDLGDNFYIGIPEILTEKNENQRTGRDYYYMNIYDDRKTGTWWEKESGFYLKEQKDYKSLKHSMRNTESISGENAIYIRGHEINVKYIIYFFEESI